MKFILVPVHNSNSQDNFAAFIPAIILNFISASFLAIRFLLPFMTNHIPNLNSWLKFGICVVSVTILTVLSFMPYIGFILSLLSLFFWIICIFSLTKGILTSELKWGLRVGGILLVFLFEGSVFLLWK